VILLVLLPNTRGTQPEMCCNHCVAPGRLAVAGFDACLFACIFLIVVLRHGSLSSGHSASADAHIMATQSTRDKSCPCFDGGLACRTEYLHQALDATAFVGSRLWAAGQGHSTPLQGSCQAACSLISTLFLNLRNCWSQFWDVAYMTCSRWEYKALSRQSSSASHTQSQLHLALASTAGCSKYDQYSTAPTWVTYV